MKQATTIEEQISLLKNRGLIIDNESIAHDYLMDIGFYRLGFYLFPFEKTFPNRKKRDHKLIEGVKFDDVISLYNFDTELRYILLPYINKIEINLRTYITYTASNKFKFNNVWFTDNSCVNTNYAGSFIKTYGRLIYKNKVLINHHQKYKNDKYAPAWKTLEFMTMGDILNLYSNLKDAQFKTEIASHYSCSSIEIFENYFHVIRQLRNSCAHGACIYNMKLIKSIKKGPLNEFSVRDRNEISGIIKVLLFLLNKISEELSNEMKEKISMHLSNINNDKVRYALGKSTDLTL